MKNLKYYIFDFDSTLVQVEALDELAKICLKNNIHKNAIIKKIKTTTELGMMGKLDFDESLAIRLALIKPNKKQINVLIQKLNNKISPSLLRNVDFIKKNRERIYLVSGGFKDYIFPIANKLNIKTNHILANNFIFDVDNNYVGFDNKNLLAQKNGKIMAVKSLKLKGNIIAIGDGYTDWQIKDKGAAKYFIAFTETVNRFLIVNKADAVANSFEELVKVIKLF